VTHLVDLGRNHLATLALIMRYTQTAMSRYELEKACRE